MDELSDELHSVQPEHRVNTAYPPTMTSGMFSENEDQRERFCIEQTDSQEAPVLERKQDEEQQTVKESGADENDILKHLRDVAPTQSIISHGLGDFLKLKLPPREHMLAPWLTLQGLAMLYAVRGIGKTYFALGVGYAVATAGRFLCWNAEKAWRVVYIDGEMPAETMQERLATMVANDPREITEEVANNLRIVSQEQQDPAMPDLSSVEGQRLFDQVTDGADLIIVDNISTLCRAGAENKADDWNIVAEWALRMRRCGKTVLFVHHAGKGGQQRGTSKREDILDAVIALRRPLDESEDGASFEVHFEKARHIGGEDVRPFVASLSLSNGIWSTELLEENTYRRVVSLANEGHTCSEIAREIDKHKSTVSRHLKNAKQKGDLGRENDGATPDDYANRRA